MFSRSTIVVVILIAWFAMTGCREADQAPQLGDAPTLLPQATAPSEPAEAEASVPASDEPAQATPAARATPTATAPTATPVPTATSRPKSLTICIGAEPASLYRYDPALTTSLPAQHIWHALYENLFATVDFAYQPQGLATIPSLANGDVNLESVRVGPGELVADADGFVRPLARGVQLIDDTGHRYSHPGGEATLTRLAVTFRLRPMRWSDGTPVTADDSRFSFELVYGRDADDNARLNRIARYEAMDALTIRYETIPGYIEPDYLLQLYPPMPRHQLEGIPRSSLPTSEAAARQPLSNGPFAVQEWIAGDRLILSRNPHYYRADEGYPLVDQLVFRFTPDPDQALSRLLAGECQLLTQETLGQDALARGMTDESVVLNWTPSLVFEHIDFGIEPVETYSWRRPDWFEDERVRQAFAMCLDKEALLDSAGNGLGAVMDVYVPNDHPLVPADLQRWPFDLDAANALLDKVGYIDTDDDGVREDLIAEAPFQVTLTATTDDGEPPNLALLIQEQLSRCGIAVEPRLLPVGELLADGPVGTLFGRRFDLGLFAWLTRLRPPCNLYQTSAIPGPPDRSPAGWSGLNVSGWSNEAYDAACARAMTALPGTEAYAEAHQEALRLFAEYLPAVPLFARARTTLSSADVRGLQLDAGQSSELWNLFAIDLEPGE